VLAVEVRRPPRRREAPRPADYEGRFPATRLIAAVFALTATAELRPRRRRTSPDRQRNPRPSAEAVSARRWRRYDLKNLLGQGGMGDVWLGRDRKLRRPVAVKVVSSAGPTTGT